MTNLLSCKIIFPDGAIVFEIVFRLVVAPPVNPVKSTQVGAIAKDNPFSKIPDVVVLIRTIIDLLLDFGTKKFNQVSRATQPMNVTFPKFIWVAPSIIFIIDIITSKTVAVVPGAGENLIASSRIFSLSSDLILNRRISMPSNPEARIMGDLLFQSASIVRIHFSLIATVAGSIFV